MEKVFISHSDQETKKLAQELGASLKTGLTICLGGEMAAGKTTFSQGIGLAFGISRMVSPTFMIMREYPITNHPIIKRLFHIDLYRLQTVEEIKAFNLEELWSDPSHLLLIEWPEIANELLPENRLNVNIKDSGYDQREITVTKHFKP